MHIPAVLPLAAFARLGTPRAPFRGGGWGGGSLTCLSGGCSSKVRLRVTPFEPLTSASVSTTTTLQVWVKVCLLPCVRLHLGLNPFPAGFNGTRSHEMVVCGLLAPQLGLCDMQEKWDLSLEVLCVGSWCWAPFRARGIINLKPNTVFLLLRFCGSILHHR